MVCIVGESKFLSIQTVVVHCTRHFCGARIDIDNLFNVAGWPKGIFMRLINNFIGIP